MNKSIKLQNIFFGIILGVSVISCKTTKNSSSDVESIGSDIADLRYGISRGVFARIFAKNVCSCLFVNGYETPGFDVAFCNEQAGFFFPIDVLGRSISARLDWINTIKADIWPKVAYKKGTDPIYVIAKGSNSYVLTSPNGVAQFDPKRPELGCRLVSEKSASLPPEVRSAQ